MRISNSFAKDKWLSKITDKNSYKCINLNFEERDYPKKIEFLYVKISQFDKKNYLKLKKKKFKYINKSIIFEKKISQIKTKISNIRKANIKDKKKIQKIAVENLNSSRFNLDKKIKKKAGLIKSEWINNFFKKKRGDALYLVEYVNKVAGFVLLLFDKKELIIDLIAIDKKYQNKGLGRTLIKFIEKIYYKKFKTIKVGTQSNNKNSLIFYRKNKFKIIKKELVFHKHFIND
jgi:ribosomal protein S18 acetylase RimI-like enzyme